MKSEDIARLAGVSRSTVSRVINNYQNVPDETREKVMKIINKYDYQPNSFARALAGKGMSTIGLFVVSIAEKQNINRIYQNNYFSAFINAVLDTANNRNYYVLIHTIYSKEDYIKVKQSFMQKRIDGGIIVGTEKDIDVISDIMEMGYPLSIIDYNLQEIMNKTKNSQLSVINSMDYEGAFNALEYLIELGHRKIGVIAGRLNTFSGKQRFKAYEDVLRKYNIKATKSFILHGKFLKSSAIKETEKLIKSGKLPTAIFSCNDEMALAAIEVFRKSSIRIPEDISIIGFDNIPLASLINPSLTSVSVPIYDMAKKSVEMLIDMFNDTSKTFSTLTFPTKLIERESCRRVTGNEL